MYYISFDPFSLIDRKFKVCCGFEHSEEEEEEENNDSKRLKSMSINDAIFGSEIFMKDLYNALSAPTTNIVTLLHFLKKQHEDQIVHFLIDEFNRDLLTKSYSTKLGESLKRSFEESTVVIALQSVNKERVVRSSDDQNIFKTEAMDIGSSGMKIFELKTAVRMSSQLHELQRNLEHETESCPFKVPLYFKGNLIFLIVNCKYPIYCNSHFPTFVPARLSFPNRLNFICFYQGSS